MLKNAGVLFYTFIQGETWVLLAKESFIEGYKNSGVWSAFEGGPEKGENVAMCALRECQEESLGVVMDTSTLAKRIETCPRIEMTVESQQHPKTFVIYLIETDYNPETSTRFHNLRKCMTYGNEKIMRYKGLAESCREIELPVVGSRIDSSVILDVYHIFRNSDTGVVWMHISCLQNGTVQQIIHPLKGLTNERYTLLKNTFKAWQEVKAVVCNGDTKKYFVPKLDDWFLTGYSPKSEFFEKSEIRWFKLSQLVENLAPNKRSNVQLRYSFSVLLTLVLERTSVFTRGKMDDGVILKSQTTV